VEALSAKVDKDRQRTEALLIEKNEEMIAKNADAIDRIQKDFNAHSALLREELSNDISGINKTISEHNVLIIQAAKSASDSKEQIQGELKSLEEDLWTKIKQENEENTIQNTKIGLLEKNQSESSSIINLLQENILKYQGDISILQALVARVNNIEEMRQKGELQAKEDIKLLIEGVRENMDKLENDINKTLDEANKKHAEDDNKTQVSISEIKDNLIVLNSEGVTFKETLGKYQELLENKLKEVDQSTNENTSEINIIKEILMTTSEKVDSVQSETKKDLDNLSAELPKTLDKSLDIFRTDIKEDMGILHADMKLYKNRIESLENLINKLEIDFGDNTKRQSDAFDELKNMSKDMHYALRNEYDGKLKEMSDLLDKYGKDSEINRNFIQSSQEIFNTLTMGNARQDERINSLESLSQVMDNKLGSLESADLFLQEAHRMLTDKTTLVETESKKLEGTVMTNLRNQREDLEMTLKKQITMLLKDIEDLNSGIARNDDAIDRLDNQSLENQNKISTLEDLVGKQNKESTESLQLAITNIENNYSKKIGDLELVVNQNREHVEENNQNIENNSGSINTILDEIELFKNRIESLDVSVEQHKNEVNTMCQDTSKQLSEKISHTKDSLDDTIKVIKEEIEDLKNADKDLIQKLENSSGALQINITSLREEMKENDSKIQTACASLDHRVNEHTVHIEDIFARISDLNTKHLSISEQLNETNLLVKNVEVLIKNQELKLDEQKAKDFAGFEDRFVSLEKINKTLHIELNTLQEGCENTLARLENLESSFDTQTKKTAEVTENLVSKVILNTTNITTHETHISEILETIRVFVEKNKLHAEKLHLLEMLSDRVDQLDETRAKDDIRWTTALESLSDHYAKELEKMRTEAQNMFVTINSSEFTSLLQSSSELKTVISELIEKNAIIFKSIEDLGLTDKDMNALLNKNCKSLEDNIAKNQASIEEILEALGDLNDENKYNKEKLISMEEAYHIQGEKAVYVESMMSKMDEMRQQSEAKSKEELSASLQNNTRAIDTLRIEIEARITNIFEQLTTELQTIRTSQEMLGTSMQEDQQKAIQNFGQEQESKIVAIMKIIENHKTLIEKTHTSVTKITERVIQNETVQNNSQETFILENTAKINQLQDMFERQIASLLSQNAEQQTMIVSNLEDINDSRQQLTSFTAGIMQDIKDIKDTHESEKELIVSRIQENTNTLEAFFNTLGTRVDKIETTQIQETSRLEQVERHFVERTRQDEQLLARVVGLERTTSEHQGLIHNLDKSVREKVEEFDMDLNDYKKSSKEELRSIRSEMRTDKENLWELIIEIYSAFRGSTLVLKSEGAVKHHQADVLGVYRMVDSYNDRPVYKQDQGENYIYYSATSNSWLVGTVVGHQYGWLRNPSENAGKRRWIPDLRSGWEYRPLVRGNQLGNGWCTDDGTLRIESLKDVEKVNELIRDIKNSTEVD